MEPYLGTKLVIIIAFAFWLISTTSVYLFYLVVLHLGSDFTANAHQLWQLRYFGLGITSASLLVSFLAAWLLSGWLGKLQEANEGWQQKNNLKDAKLAIKPTELQAVINKIIEDFDNLLEHKNLELINAIPSDTPLVAADTKLLRQILHNLIDSALKFTDAGVIKISAVVVGHQLEITVADFGTTMEIEQLEEMFGELTDDLIPQEFNCTDPNLVTTKQLVELQGGKLYCLSTAAQSPQFTFTLPIAQNVSLASLASLPRSAQAKIVTTSGLSTASTGKFTILVVDDDKISLQILTKLLTLQNYEVVQSTNGMQALEKIEQGLEPDLIILDIMMPQINGYEVCQKIRESFSANQLPIIMLTAKEQPSDLVEGLSYGANDYLVKPINRSELVARVKAHIQLAKVNTAYGRFVPNEFIQLLGHESILDVKLGDHVKKEMAILFSDIRSFTTLSEQMSPEENFAFINSYLKMVVPAIRNYNGFIDKYIGDAVMAVFPKQAEDALRAAIAMQKQVLRYNCDRVADGEVPIAIGTGIHVGSLMLGTVGEEQRMEETVISDAVNVASRLEGLTKIFGSTVIFSEKILIELEDPTQYRYRFLGKVPVKGRKDAISVFEAFDGESPELIELKLKTRVDFELGISFYYDRKFTEGSEMFERVLKKNSADKAALLYLERCQKFRK
ncbi:MAG: response regulator [Symploca sp. SIO2G7]|nr:response regulator [Symploca sp. SIO2G7]